MALEDVAALVVAQAESRRRLRAALLDLVEALVRGFSDWYSSPAIARLAREAVSYVEPAQRQTAAVTDAYLARVAGDLTGRAVRPAGALRDVASLRAGVTHAGVYGRVADQYRWEVSQGRGDDVAAARALERAQVMAETDLALATREQSRRFMVINSVDGHRRVLRPELSQDGACGLCIAASDRVYRRAELQPIHDRCKCEPLPIIDGRDPGQSLNTEDLRAVYAAAGGTAAAALKRVRVEVHEHGELGPVLRVAGHDFRGPNDLAA